MFRRQNLVKIFVSDAIETRLRMIIPYIDRWPQALATLTLSRAIPTTLSNLLTLVDDICYYAGDRSVDVRNVLFFYCSLLFKHVTRYYYKMRTAIILKSFICAFLQFDWYVRRIALAGIYKATELYMLQDKSTDYENTWKFLKTQLDDAVEVYSCVQQSEQASQLTKEISQATFITVSV